MKICYISNLYPPLILGGAEVYVRNIAEELVKKGDEIVVITTSLSRKSYIEYINDVKIYRLGILNIYPMYTYGNQPELLKPLWHTIDIWNPHSYKIIKNILIREKPDIVHIHNFKGVSLSVFSAVKSLGIPLVFTAHDYSLICPRANMLNSKDEICKKPSNSCVAYIRLQRYLVNNLPDLITAPSQFVIDKLREYGFFENTKAIKLPLGIKINKKKIKKSYEIIDVLYVGSLSRHKGVHILIQAFKKLKYENMRLHIVGKGKDAGEFKRMAGNDPRIRFYGFIPEEKLKKLYEMANIVVVPSIWYENSPVVIYESFMSGTPVIGSRIGGIPELIRDGYNGLLFEAGNVDQLKEVLESLVADDHILRKLELGAGRSIMVYDMDKHIRCLKKIYEEVSACSKEVI